MHKKKDKKEYSVGYKKPPRHTRFEPGRSGNPKGRPKKVKSLTDIFDTELQARVPVSSNGKKRRVSMLELIVRQYLNKAAGGDAKAAALIFKQLRESNAGGGDKLGDLVQEFRAIHTSRVDADADRLQSTKSETNDKERR